MTEPALRECFGCGQFQLVPVLGPDMRSDCVRCGVALRRTRRDPLNRALALNFTALVLFAIVWLAMLLTVSKAGIEHATTLISGPIELVKHGLWPLGLVVFFTTAIAPLGKIAGTIYVLIGLRMSRLPPNLRGVFLFAHKMGIWAMLEVLMLGVFVAYTKLGDLVNIEVGPAIFALGLLSLVTIWADTVLDPDAVWEAIEKRGQTHRPMPAVPSLDFHPHAIGCEACGLVSVPPEHDSNGHDAKCPRCGSALHARKPDSLNRTWAFIIASAILYIPANVYPVLTVIQAGAGQPSTILGGVEELLSSGMYPLALLVFVASVLDADVQAARDSPIMMSGDHAGRHRKHGGVDDAAGAHQALLCRRLDRPLVDGRHLHGIAARRAGSVRRHRQHRPRHRRRRLLRRGHPHHLRRGGIRSAPDVGCRGPQRTSPAGSAARTEVVRCRTSWVGKSAPS